MTQEDSGKPETKANQDRRDFLRRAGKASLGVPATAVLLSVTNKSAKAWGSGYGGEHTYDYSEFKEWLEDYFSNYSHED
jgi:hypothetical protein